MLRMDNISIIPSLDATVPATAALHVYPEAIRVVSRCVSLKFESRSSDNNFSNKVKEQSFQNLSGRFYFHLDRVKSVLRGFKFKKTVSRLSI